MVSAKIERLAVSENREELKEEMKTRYDKENKAEIQGWKIGQKVLLQSHRIKPLSDCVLAHKNYTGPYFIVDICAKDGIGPAYRLVECETGKTLRRLIAGDRLKPYMAERLVLRARLPSRIPEIPQVRHSTPTATDSQQARGLRTLNKHAAPKKANTNGTQQRQQQQQRRRCNKSSPTDFYPAKKILRERVRNGVKEFLVNFVDDSFFYTSDVTPTLLRLYRLNKERINERRRRSGRQKKLQGGSQ